MKRNILLNLATVTLLMSSCSLDLDPIDRYSDVTEGIETNVAFSSESDVITHLQTMLTSLRESEHMWQDVLLLAEIHSDNAYSGNEGGAPPAFEKNDVADMMSKPPLQRDWNRRMNNIAKANKLISNIDQVPSSVISDKKKLSYKAQALIYRAMLYYDMVLLWGRVPLILSEAGDITADNIEESYYAYFPKQNSEEEVYAQIEKDLLEAVDNAPDDLSNKMQMSKGLAYALLAKIYADNTSLRNYDKVIEYADKLADMGYGLVDDFSLLFGVKLQDDSKPVGTDNVAVDVKARNTKESIFEIQFSGNDDRGSFNNQIFGVKWDTYTPVTFSNWVLPTHNLIDLFEQEPEDKRYPETIHYYGGTMIGFTPPRDWGYSLDHYPHMFKCRSVYNSNIKYRYADILLLKAEACILKDNPNLSTAASIINEIRKRAGLSALSTEVTSNKDKLFNAYLNERRKELAFEGHRWNDLTRLEIMEDVMNAYKSSDKYARLTDQYTRAHYKFPIQKSVLSSNSMLTQNEGY